MRFLFTGLLLSVSFTAQAAFSDTNQYDWQESIAYLAEQDVVQGYDDGSYRPNATINRAEFTKIVMASAYEDDGEWEDWGESCFSDVKSGDWYAPYVCAAEIDNIVAGYPDGSFKPFAPINQAEALKILYETFYEDVEDTGGAWYQQYLDAAEFDGMLYFSPQNPAAHRLTRGQMAYFTAWILDDYGELNDEIAFEDFYGEDYDDTDFGWDTMTAADCFEDEYFDDADGQCYLLEDEYDFAGEEDFYDDQDFNQLDHHPHGQETLRAENQAAYSINGDVIDLKSPSVGTDSVLFNTNYHRQVWERFTQLIPTANRNKITELVLFNNPSDDTAAYVEAINDDLTTWRLGVNLDGTFDASGQWADTKEFDLTLIHEFAHVFTLNDAQIDPNVFEDTCAPNFYPGEGCARPKAFINLFFKKFWTRPMYQTITNDPDYGGETLYAQHPKKFVTEYAATNPGEDIAETFSYFVARSKPERCEATGVTQKLCFFYQFPQLVTLRKNIRAGLQP